MTARVSIKAKLIKQAVKKLKRFGFTNVTEENITTDDVYKFYFMRILRPHIGQNKETDQVIHDLFEKIKGFLADSSELNRGSSN
jgi:hypothetical protein